MICISFGIFQMLNFPYKKNVLKNILVKNINSVLLLFWDLNTDHLYYFC